MLRARVLVAVASLFAVSCSGSPSLSAESVDLIDRYRITSDTMAELESLASTNGWSLDEAISRAGWWWSFAAYVDELRRAYPEELAGAAFNAPQEPNAVTIAFTRSVPPAVRSDRRTEAFSIRFIELVGITEVESANHASGIQPVEVQQALDIAGYTSLVSVYGQYAGRTTVALIETSRSEEQLDAEMAISVPGIASNPDVIVRPVAKLPTPTTQPLSSAEGEATRQSLVPSRSRIPPVLWARVHLLVEREPWVRVRA